MVIIKTQGVCGTQLIIEIDACLFIIVIAVTKISIVFSFVGIQFETKLFLLHAIVKSILSSIVTACGELHFACVGSFFRNNIDNTAFGLTVSCGFSTFNNFNTFYQSKGDCVPVNITATHNATHGLGNTIY